jgi:hypothetical protein
MRSVTLHPSGEAPQPNKNARSNHFSSFFRKGLQASTSCGLG